MNTTVYLALLPLVGCCLFGYMWSTSLPTGIANPNLHRFNSALTVFYMAFAIVGSKLGLGDRLELYRQLSDYQNSFLMDRHAGLEVKEAVLDGVPVVIYKPLTVRGPLPALVFLHGGGFIMMSSIHTDPMTSAIARDTQAVVVSVDYRLSPEHAYPAALDDCYAVTKYLIQHAEEFDLDPRRIAVGGISSGGNLAAAVALRFRDNKKPVQPKLQILIQPFLQTFNLRLPSHQQHQQVAYTSEMLALVMLWYMGDARYFERLEVPPEAKLIANNSHTSIEMKRVHAHIFDLLPESMRRGYELQEANESGNEAFVAKYSPMILDPYAFPLMADNFENLPQAFIMTSEFDTLRDDGVLYAKHLEKAGVPVTWYHSPDTFHGLHHHVGPMLRADTAVRDVNEMIAFLQEYL